MLFVSNTMVQLHHLVVILWYSYIICK